MKHRLICAQGAEQFGLRQAAWPLSPAQEHKYDALAAFDAGHLQEAQHAFDLSVWSDLKSDKGKDVISASVFMSCPAAHGSTGTVVVLEVTQ